MTKRPGNTPKASPKPNPKPSPKVNQPSKPEKSPPPAPKSRLPVKPAAPPKPRIPIMPPAQPRQKPQPRQIPPELREAMRYVMEHDPDFEEYMRRNNIRFHDPDANAIMRDEYATPGDAVIIEGPIRAKSARGPIGESWWAQQWVQAMEENDPYERLDRGKNYARKGAVRRLEISYGIAFAQVQGSDYRPYSTKIELQQFTDAEWDKALKALSDQAIYVAKLLAGEMPSDIEDVFQGVKLSLFPRDRKEINFVCSCPDYAHPCKHAAAVYYLLAERLDSDPFTLFHLRGRTRDQVLTALHGDPKPAPTATKPVYKPLNAPETLANFWNGSRPLPTLPMPGTLVPSAVLAGGEPPGNIADQLWEIYGTMSRIAREQLEIGSERGGISLDLEDDED